MTRNVLLRVGLWFLTLTQVAVGGWQLFLPRSFFDGAPLPGNPWVALLPPYNEHLMRDVGALNLGLAVVIGVAAVTAERRLARIALVAYLVWAVPHFVFHATHLHHYTLGDAVGQTITLGIAALLPAALLLTTRGAPPDAKAT